MLQESIEYLETDWKSIIKNINDNIDDNLDDNIEKEMDIFTIYPPIKNIFSAFSYFNFTDLEIIIIGQDPYYREHQANGLCFSVNDGIKIPPSLVNIFKEIHANFNPNENFILPKSGNLEYLAKQNMLLLNKTLTVREGQPNSHIKYWNKFNKAIINYILENSENKIFLLWGNNAKTIKKNIPIEILNKHIFLESNHPSPLSANKGGWFGNRHFSKVNDILDKQNKPKKIWINSN